MVLLTSSTISVIISSGVVCTFTFLLFLSGYVLQQQTVRSLQDAIRNPQEKVAIPTPTLPPQFQVFHEGETQIRLDSAGHSVISESLARTTLKDTSDEANVKQLWHDYVRSSNGPDMTDALEMATELDSGIDAEQPRPSEPITTRERLGYILAMPNARNLCSAVLFTQKHRALTSLTTQPSIIFIYPANWDVSSDPSHTAAMDLLRDVQDNFGVTLHPVTISRVWAGISVEQQLLGELQRYRWPYDRAMYLGNPGMLVDTAALDQSLALSNTKASWTLLHPSPKSYEASHPPMLLWVSGRGLLYPRKDAKKLIARISTSDVNDYVNELRMNRQAKEVAYVLFDEKSSDYEVAERFSFNEVYERFERDRRNTCAGTGLLHS